MERIIKTAVSVLIPVIAIASALMTIFAVSQYTVPVLIGKMYFDWAKAILFPAGALAFTISSVVSWIGVRRLGMGAAFKFIFLAGLLSLPVVFCFSRRWGLSAVPENLTGWSIRPPSATDAVLKWDGVHFGLPIDFLHLYKEVNGSGLWLSLDPHWLAIDYSVVFSVFYWVLLTLRFGLQKR